MIMYALWPLASDLIRLGLSVGGLDHQLTYQS